MNKNKNLYKMRKPPIDLQKIPTAGVARPKNDHVSASPIIYLKYIRNRWEELTERGGRDFTGFH